MHESCMNHHDTLQIYVLLLHMILLLIHRLLLYFQQFPYHVICNASKKVATRLNHLHLLLDAAAQHARIISLLSKSTVIGSDSLYPPTSGEERDPYR